jgi:Cof subfamily protein (haloacid dehalogenase superfamily)
MDLVVFDLDGTLLNARSEISSYTRETLSLLQQRNIAYTVATGRTLHATQDLLIDRGFALPQIYKNGVVIWHPGRQQYTHQFLLTPSEIGHVVEAFLSRGVTPFLFSLEPGQHHAVYHPPLQNPAEHSLAETIAKERLLPVHPVAELPALAELTNISALGPRDVLEAVAAIIAEEPDLVAYMGVAIEDKDLCWMDIHHSDGSKGDAVSVLRRELGASRVICFGDSDNDLSMFNTADESYAPANAKSAVKAAATEVIGHHDEDGIASFLRRRFDLPS